MQVPRYPVKPDRWYTIAFRSGSLIVERRRFIDSDEIEIMVQEDKVIVTYPSGTDLVEPSLIETFVFNVVVEGVYKYALVTINLGLVLLNLRLEVKT